MFTLLFRFQHFLLKTPLGKPIRGNYSLLWKCRWPFNAPHQRTPSRVWLLWLCLRAKIKIITNNSIRSWARNPSLCGSRIFLGKPEGMTLKRLFTLHGKMQFWRGSRASGGYSTKFYAGWLYSDVQRLIFLRTIFERKGIPFVYPLLTNVTPFTYLVLHPF